MGWLDTITGVCALIISVLVFVLYYLSEKMVNEAERLLQENEEQIKNWDLRKNEDMKAVNALIKRFEYIVNQSNKQRDEDTARILNSIMEKLNER